MSKVVVIGGGAAGCMAAIAASECGHSVVLLEKNEKLGKKIYITGKGRCNFTNACDVEDFLNNVVSNKKFLYSALYTFSPDSMIDFVETNGIPTKVERGNRAFPSSDHASDITKALERSLKKNNVDIRLKSNVVDLLLTDGAVSGVRLSDKSTVSCEHVIICTGGLSYQTTGSTGDGLKFAKKLGLEIIETRPALVPMNCAEEYVKKMQGLSLKNVELSIFDESKCIYKAFGEMLFTHFGVSGPLVLSASSIIGKLLQKKKLSASVDLKPALSFEQLDDRVLREFNSSLNKNISNVLRKLLPSSMIEVFLTVLKMPEDRQINSITKEERTAIVSLLKAFPFTLISLRDYNEAIVTAGGVSVKEIDPSTMKCKTIEGLSFAGEVIDVDAYTGGFNLQIAFSTGYLSGISI